MPKRRRGYTRNAHSQSRRTGSKSTNASVSARSSSLRPDSRLSCCAGMPKRETTHTLQSRLLQAPWSATTASPSQRLVPRERLRFCDHYCRPNSSLAKCTGTHLRSADISAERVNVLADGVARRIHTIFLESMQGTKRERRRPLFDLPIRSIRNFWPHSFTQQCFYSPVLQLQCLSKRH